MASFFKKGLQAVSRPVMFKQGGKWIRRNSTAVITEGSLSGKPAPESRVVHAEVIHGDEQEFWAERRKYYQRRGPYMPSWDRFAQTMILMSRSVPRVPQEAAFRLMAVFLKMLLVTRVAEMSHLMLPLWTTMNMENLLVEAKKGDDAAKKKKDDEGGAKENNTATPPATGDDQKGK